MRGRGLLAVLTIVLVASSGCGYQLAGRGSFLPETVKTIAIPPFDSMVPRHELVKILTDEVTRVFLSRGGYRIVPTTEGADALLVGSVRGLLLSPVSVDAEGRQTQSNLSISAGVTLRNLKTDEVLYDNPSFYFTTQVELGADVLDPELTAIQEVAKDFAKSLVSTIVEGF